MARPVLAQAAELVRAPASPARVRRHRARAAAGAVLLLAIVAGCGDAAPKDAALRKEAVEIAERLGTVEERVVAEDPELRRWDEALGTALLREMNEVDPGLAALGDSAEALRARRARARRMGDLLSLRRADAALARLERRFLIAREQALRGGEITASMQAFDSVVRARMTEREPATPRLLARYRALAGQLTGAP